jgi:ATP-binding cassette subfamily B protein
MSNDPRTVGDPSKHITVVQRDGDEEVKQAPLSLWLIVRLFKYTRPYALKRNMLLLIVLVRSIQLPLLAFGLGLIIKGPVTDGEPWAVVTGAGLYLLLALITQLTFHFRARFALELGERVVHDLRRDIFQHLQRMPMSFFHRWKLGRLLSRMISDVEAVRVGVQDVLFISLVQGGQMIVAGVVMLIYDWQLFMSVVAMVPVLWAINRYFRKKLSEAWRVVQESFSRVTATLAESVSGIRVTQGFVRQDVNAGLFGQLVADHGRYNVDVSRNQGVFLPLLEFNNQIFLAVLLLVGGWQVANGVVDVGDLVVFFFMSTLFFQPIQVIGGQLNQAFTAMAGAERVFALLDTEPEWQDADDAVELPPIEGRVEFRHVTFGYKPDTMVLHDINFVAEPGQTIAFVGHTGSGKSSIINLISKFYLPDKGQIYMDDYEIRQITGESLHRQMGVVLQQNFLFTGPVKENIRFAKPDATDDEIRDAARTLDCLDLLEALPDGLDTMVGEGGAGISLGQRQLICFTRAMLANPRILILDEATSAVDTMTEVRIQRSLERLFQGRTNFVVAHRLSTIRHANMVIVLDHGRIIERGPHNALLSAGGVYANLYRQFIHATEA